MCLPPHTKDAYFEPLFLTYVPSYDKRLGAIAIEVAEDAIALAADSGQAEISTMPSHVSPAEQVKSMSYEKSPPSGSSIGLAGDPRGTGTLGAFLCIVSDGTPQYFALTCSHVLSCTYLFILGPFPHHRTRAIGSHIYFW